MNITKQLCEISKLNGRFTESVLTGRGLSQAAIARAVAFRLLTRDHSGVLSTIQPKFRNSKLSEAVAVDLKPGRQVGVLNPDTKQMMQRTIVSMNGNDVMVIDPLHPQQIPQKVALENIAATNERDTNNKPIDPQKEPDKQQQQQQQQSVASSPVSKSMDNPTPTV